MFSTDTSELWIAPQVYRPVSQNHRIPGWKALQGPSGPVWKTLHVFVLLHKLTLAAYSGGSSCWSVYCPISLVSLANLVMVHLILSSRPLMNVLNSSGLSVGSLHSYHFALGESMLAFPTRMLHLICDNPQQDLFWNFLQGLKYGWLKYGWQASNFPGPSLSSSFG